MLLLGIVLQIWEYLSSLVLHAFVFCRQYFKKLSTCAIKTNKGCKVGNRSD